jgi:hypothetical protein
MVKQIISLKRLTLILIIPDIQKEHSEQTKINKKEEALELNNLVTRLIHATEA